LRRFKTICRKLEHISFPQNDVLDRKEAAGTELDRAAGAAGRTTQNLQCPDAFHKNFRFELLRVLATAAARPNGAGQPAPLSCSCISVKWMSQAGVMTRTKCAAGRRALPGVQPVVSCFGKSQLLDTPDMFLIDDCNLWQALLWLLAACYWCGSTCILHHATPLGSLLLMTWHQKSGVPAAITP
jgi:hypothetical protein